MSEWRWRGYYRLCRHRLRRATWVAAVRPSRRTVRNPTDAGLGQGHATLGEPEAASHRRGIAAHHRPRYPQNVAPNPTTSEVFALMTWRDRRFAAISQAGLIENLSMPWSGFLPSLLPAWHRPADHWLDHRRLWPGVGESQLITGKLSDHIGRHLPNVMGMWICGTGVAMMLLGEGVVWWSVSPAVSGFGMALLYPNLSAAVADISPPNWRVFSHRHLSLLA